MSAREKSAEPTASAAAAAHPASAAPAPAASAAPASAPVQDVESEAESTSETVPHRRRRLSLPEDFSGVRHYHVHEHHYHVWEHTGGCCGGARSWSGPWQLWQPRHSRRGRSCSACSSGAWAPPWVFGHLGPKAGRFSLTGGLIFLVAMALCRGIVWLVRVHRPQPALE